MFHDTGSEVSPSHSKGYGQESGGKDRSEGGVRRKDLDRWVQGQNQEQWHVLRSGLEVGQGPGLGFERRQPHRLREEGL